MRNSLLTLLILCIFAHPCSAAPGAKKEVKEGNLLYNKEKFDEALEKYEDAFIKMPDSDVVNFDLGTALYKTEGYKASAGHFEKALVSGDESLVEKASYNIGNAKYKYGIGKEEEDLKSAINLLEQSLRHYERAMELDQKDEDVKHNYEFVKKELERLKKKQQQPQQQQQDKKDKKEQEQTPQGGKEGEQQEKKKEPEEQQQDQQQQQDQEEQEQDQQDQQQEDRQQQEQPLDEMTKEEAEMLLESYKHEEEPKGLYEKKKPTRGLPDVLKDW